MFVETLTIVVKEGFSDQVVARFSKEGAVEKSNGFLDLSVLVKKASKGEEEVIVLIRWESKAHWKEWEMSDAHIQGHKRSREQGRPEYILRSHSSVYEVKAIKTA